MTDAAARQPGLEPLPVALAKTPAQVVREIMCWNGAAFVLVRTELETVAVNAERGFRQTHEGLIHLASHAVADHSPPSGFTSPESKTH